MAYEVDQAIAERNLPFFRRVWFVKSAVAGIFLFSFLVGYVEIVFRPTQEKLRNKIDTAAYKLEQREAQFGSEKARLELHLEQATLEAKIAVSKNESAGAQLLQAKNAIDYLQSILDSLNSGKKKSKEIEDAKSLVNKELDNIVKAQDAVAQQSIRIKDISAR